MALTPGTRLGVYEITAQIAEGGMGQVFRATDTKLKRQVAIKILPPAVAADAERLARFQREAEVLASLNHPNIAAIYGLEESGGMTALVMELVEGDDLSQRIARGAIPIDEALQIAKQIAEALEAAHEQGIIHRDLKPANIKVRSDGTVKVLDFGLAKAMEPPDATRLAADAGLTQSPTIATPAMMTRIGMILGTTAYMSPEQAKGRPADKRSDIWAFGCVLYEMLTGRRVFEGEDVSDTLAAVLRAEPDWRALPSTVPPTVVRLLPRCLERDRTRRWRDIGDAKLELDTALAETATSSVVRQPATARRVRRWLWPLGWLLTAAAITTLAAVAMQTAARSPDEPSIRFQIDSPSGLRMSLLGTGLAMSPDGRAIAFVARGGDGPWRVWVRRFGAEEAHELRGTDDAWNPFWSPDGRSVGFVVNRSIFRIDLVGGPPQRIVDIPQLTDIPVTVQGSGSVAPTWCRDGVILFSTAKLFRVTASGGAATPMELDTPAGHGLSRWPRCLPDGQQFLMPVIPRGGGREGPVLLASLGSRVTTPLGDMVHGPVVYSAGHVVYLRDTVVMARPIDLAHRRLTGEAIPLSDRLSGNPLFSVSPNGTLAFASGGGLTRRLVWMGRDGRRLGTVDKPALVSDARISPDGRQLAAAISEGQGANINIWVYDLQRGVPSRLAAGRNPIWSPDGRRLAYSAIAPRANDSRLVALPGIVARSADGAGDPEQMLTGSESGAPADWSPDGHSLLFRKIPDTGVLRLLSVDSGHQVRPFVDVPGVISDARFSPDGRWVAFDSNDLGASEVFVAPVDRGAARQRVSTGGGASPRWSKRGSELDYVVDRTIMAVPTSSGATLSIGTPRALFAASPGATISSFDVTRDGERFLLVVSDEATDKPSIAVVTHWTARTNER